MLDGTERFFDLIYPYVPQSMKYKLSSVYSDRQCVLDGVSFEPVNAILETKVVKIEPTEVRVYECGNVQYDLTIADNHNYFAGDILVHNSNVGVARIGDYIFPLGRAGYLASSSPYVQHRHFATWVHKNYSRFLAVLQDGERLVGEWLLQAHGTRYKLWHEPFVAFDIMTGSTRLPYGQFSERIHKGYFATPYILHMGEAISIEEALRILGEKGFHGAIDKAEGAVWRVERNKLKDRHSDKREQVVDFLVKYVRPDKVDGVYLDNDEDKEIVWNLDPKLL